MDCCELNSDDGLLKAILMQSATPDTTQPDLIFNDSSYSYLHNSYSFNWNSLSEYPEIISATTTPKYPIAEQTYNHFPEPSAFEDIDFSNKDQDFVDWNFLYSTLETDNYSDFQSSSYDYPPNSCTKEFSSNKAHYYPQGQSWHVSDGTGQCSARTSSYFKNEPISTLPCLDGPYPPPDTTSDFQSKLWDNSDFKNSIKPNITKPVLSRPNSAIENKGHLLKDFALCNKNSVHSLQNYRLKDRFQPFWVKTPVEQCVYDPNQTATSGQCGRFSQIEDSPATTAGSSITDMRSLKPSKDRKFEASDQVFAKRSYSGMALACSSSTTSPSPKFGQSGLASGDHDSQTPRLQKNAIREPTGKNCQQYFRLPNGRFANKQDAVKICPTSCRLKKKKNDCQPMHLPLMEFSIGDVCLLKHSNVKLPRKTQNKFKIFFSAKKFLYEVRIKDIPFGLTKIKDDSATSDLIAVLEVPFCNIVGICTTSNNRFKMLLEAPAKFYVSKQKSRGHRSTFSGFAELDFLLRQARHEHVIVLTKPLVSIMRARLLEYDRAFGELLTASWTFDSNSLEYEKDPSTIAESLRVARRALSASKKKRKKSDRKKGRPRDTDRKFSPRNSRYTLSKNQAQISYSYQRSDGRVNEACNCRISCSLTRCDCFKSGVICDSAVCNCTSCDNPYNVLSNANVNLDLAKRDVCFYDNMARKQGLEWSRNLTALVDFPCCKKTRYVFECLSKDGSIACDSYSCKGNRQEFSWCLMELFEFGNRNHCTVCKKCNCGHFR